MLTQAQPHRAFREPTEDELALRRWLGLLLSAGWMVPQTSGAKTPVVKLVVKLFNYAEISPQVLAGAEREAVRVYREAGILLSWVECGLSEQDTEKFLACEQVNDPFGLFVNIIGQPMAVRLPRPGKFAVSFERHAVVFYRLVEGAAEDGRFSKALILGCVMAHELGHLLLGENSHATGIMRGTFRRQDFERAEKGKLVFTQHQAEAMQARILKRLSQ